MYINDGSRAINSSSPWPPLTSTEANFSAAISRAQLASAFVDNGGTWNTRAGGSSVLAAPVPAVSPGVQVVPLNMVPLTHPVCQRSQPLGPLPDTPQWGNAPVQPSGFPGLNWLRAHPILAAGVGIGAILLYVKEAKW